LAQDALTSLTHSMLSSTRTMVDLARPLALAAILVLSGASAVGLVSDAERADRSSNSRAGAGAGAGATVRQTPEELGFSDTGAAEQDDSYGHSEFGENFCLDLGAKGFPIPTFEMMKAVNWNAEAYFQQLQGAGYSEDALQLSGPGKAVLKGDCMRERFVGKMKHIFVGDSQMMALRNAFHRLNRCPEIWYTNHSADDIDSMMRSVQRNGRAKDEKGQLKAKSRARFHSRAEMVPYMRLPEGCTEEGTASFIHWDGWAEHQLPVEAIKKEMIVTGVDPSDGDTVVVWVGSNFIPARHRMASLVDSINKLHQLKVKMVWDSPTFHDEVVMAATTTHNAGDDRRTKLPLTLNSIAQRKVSRQMGSNEYGTERELFDSGIEIPTTKRWQITNRYRGLQCDGIHTDMRARDPLFYDMPCPMGEQRYGQSTYCAWVEPFKRELDWICPVATGLDDMVLQSGLYSMCAAHEQPFCYAYTENIR